MSSCSKEPASPNADSPLGIGGALALSVAPVPTIANGTILEVRAELDGEEFGRRLFNPPAAIVYFAVPERRIAAGSHEVRLFVVRQSANSVEYAATGSVVVVNTQTGATQQFSFPSRTSQTLQAGGSFSLQFVVQP